MRMLDISPRQPRHQPGGRRLHRLQPRPSLLHHQLPPDRVVQDDSRHFLRDEQHVRGPPDPHHHGQSVRINNFIEKKKILFLPPIVLHLCVCVLTGIIQVDTRSD